MKLPESKKERIQIFVLAGIFGAAILYGGFLFGIKPMFKKRSEAAARMETLRTRIKDAETLLRETASNGPLNTEALQKTQDLSENYFLKPRLGAQNYTPGVLEMFDRWGQAFGIKLTGLTQGQMSDIPHANAERAVVRGYGLRFTTSCGLYDLIRLLRILEQENPCTSVTRLTVLGNPADPLRHSVTLELQMPIWSDYGAITAKLAADIEANAKHGNPRTK